MQEQSVWEAQFSHYSVNNRRKLPTVLVYRDLQNMDIIVDDILDITVGNEF